MKRLLIWVPIAALTFTLGCIAAAFFIRESGLSDCVIKLQQPTEVKTPTRRNRDEVAEIYRAVLSEEGAVGLLHDKIKREAVFSVYHYARNYSDRRYASDRLPWRFVRRLESFGVEREVIENIQCPASPGNAVGNHLNTIPGIILSVDGSPRVFDKEKEMWIPTQPPPHYGGHIELSEVVCNRDRTLCVVSFGVVCGSHCGESGFCVLRKNGETWQIVGIVDLAS